MAVPGESGDRDDLSRSKGITDPNPRALRKSTSLLALKRFSFVSARGGGTLEIEIRQTD
jgi:hypothetical protein